MLHNFTVHKYVKFHFWLQEKYGLPWADIYKTWNCITTLCADVFLQISPKLGNKCGEVQKESHLPQYVKHRFQCADFHDIHPQYIFVDISCIKFYPNDKNVEHKGRNVRNTLK